jgi:hypothetical protein
MRFEKTGDRIVRGAFWNGNEVAADVDMVVSAIYPCPAYIGNVDEMKADLARVGIRVDENELDAVVFETKNLFKNGKLIVVFPCGTLNSCLTPSLGDVYVDHGWFETNRSVCQFILTEPVEDTMRVLLVFGGGRVSHDGLFIEPKINT